LPASGPPTELLTVLPHDRGCRLQPNTHTATLVDKSAFGGYASNDIFGSQYRRHFAATLTRILASNAICGVKLFVDRKRAIFPA
jgi:hypothetical protein